MRNILPEFEAAEGFPLTAVGRSGEQVYADGFVFSNGFSNT